MTLLLGPPSSGKTSLLLALAGKLHPTLKGDAPGVPSWCGADSLYVPSGVDQFKQQFVHLEEHCGKVPRPPLRRRYDSLPREQICASIDEESEQDMESKYHPISEIPHPCLESPKKSLDVERSEVTNTAKARQNSCRNSTYSERCFLRSASISASKCIGVEAVDYCEV